MIFNFDEKTISAISLDGEIVIRRSSKFYDTAGEYFYVYKGRGIEFEFCAVEKREMRNIVVKGKHVEQMMSVASFVKEPSLKEGLRAAGHGYIDQETYNEIKSEILSGMFSMLTWGGRLLSFVPDYKIELSHDR